MAVAVMAAVTAMASVGETPSQTEALPLQGAAAGLVMSHQPAAPYTDMGGGGEMVAAPDHRVSGPGSPRVVGSNLTPRPYLTPWYAADHIVDITNMVDVYHPGETIEPTPSPVQAATVRAAAQGGSLTEAEMVAVLREAGAPEEWIPPLLTIAFCESRWSPYAVGDGGNSLGMFQLWYGWARPMGYAPDDLYDPVKAARTALYVREVRGRFGGGGGWTCADLSGIY